MYYYYYKQGKTILYIVSIGIIALLLLGGQISYSQFKIPLDTIEDIIYRVIKTYQLASLLKKVDLIIWDEVLMQHRHCFEAIYCLLIDLWSIVDDLLFGGVPIILGGDFIQILPIVLNGLQAQVIGAYLQQSFIWLQLKQLYLQINIYIYNSSQDSYFIDQLNYIPYNLALISLISLLLYISQLKNIVELINYIYLANVLQAITLDQIILKD